MARIQYSTYERAYPVQTFKEIERRGNRSDVKVTLSTEERHRIYERLSDLEKRKDNLNTAVALGSFVILTVGVGIAAYQNGDAIQKGATWAWESLPNIDRVKNVISNAWDSFVSLFSNPTTYNSY
jgi:hypothetical protein